MKALGRPLATRALAVKTAALAATLLCASSAAQADSNDLVLSRLGTVSNGQVVGSNAQFRALASELGVVMAPRLSEPADTLGFGGFHFSADVAFTGISNNAEYWKVLESSTGNLQGRHGDGAMRTTGLFVKKGIWLPLPSFEFGLGAVHLGQSHLWASQGYVKFALHEGYHDLPLPSVAVRGAVSRMMGSEQLDLTVASVDLSASKDFGVAGIVKMTPFVGFNWLIIVPRSEVIDKTPHIDAREDPMDRSMNFVFQDQDNIYRSRLFFGGRVKYNVFTLTAEANFAFSGGSTDDRAGTNLSCAAVPDGMVTSDCDAKDSAQFQSTFTTSLGLDF